MKKWAMTVQYAVCRVIEVEAESYTEAVQNAMVIAESEAGDVINIEYIYEAEIALHDYEELPDEEEEFEPGRPILDQMALRD